jgi:hypothetical protein
MTLLDADVQRDPVLGEDTWELFEVIEDSFGVDLGDYSAICGLTVSELAEVVYKKANYPTEDKCLSAVAFYRLRRAFETLFDIPRKTIRPATFVGDLLPSKYRAARWLLLQEHVGLVFPALRIPGWLLCLSLVAPPALLISSSFSYSRGSFRQSKHVSRLHEFFPKSVKRLVVSSESFWHAITQLLLRKAEVPAKAAS